MKKILLTSSTHVLGLRIAKMLADKFEIVACTSDPLPDFMKANYVQIPKGLNPTFSHEMLKLALDHNCEYILPLQLAEIESLSESTMLFDEYGITVICPAKADLEVLDILPNPTKDMPLSLIVDNHDLLSGQPVEVAVNGLGVMSDSGVEFLLAIAR